MQQIKLFEAEYKAYIVLSINGHVVKRTYVEGFLHVDAVCEIHMFKPTATSFRFWVITLLEVSFSAVEQLSLSCQKTRW